MKSLDYFLIKKLNYYKMLMSTNKLSEECCDEQYSERRYKEETFKPNISQTI